MPYKDPVRRAEQRRRWADANPEKCRAAEAKYRAANPERMAAKHRRDVARRRERPGVAAAAMRRYKARYPERVKEQQRIQNERRRAPDSLAASRVYQRERRAKNPEAFRARDRAYYAKTQERRREEAREWYVRKVANPEWRATEWARLNSAGHARRAAMETDDAETRAYVKILRRDPCSYCGVMPAGGVDHIVPIKRGGRHEIDNLTAACKPCNTSKLARLLLVFLTLHASAPARDSKE